MIKHIYALLLMVPLALTALPASAHKNSDSYLRIDATAAPLQLQWSIAIRDIDFALSLDDDRNGKVTWGELTGHQSEIYDWALNHLSLQRDGGDCTFTAGELLVDKLSDGQYAVLRFPADCATSGDYTLNYQLLFKQDPNHRGLLNMLLPDGARQSVLSPSEPTASIMLSGSNHLSTAWRFFREGVWHIWIGFDHLLFLFTLLIPAVLVYRSNRWHSAEEPRYALKSIAAIVTAFTVAHSLTLTAAALGWASLPSRWVESAIAASIVLAALNNIWPLLQRKLWLLAFALGLIHGFGFAGVLADLGLKSSNLIIPLLTFNLGVEIGQLAIVFLLMPLAWKMRNTAFYQRGIVIGGSTLAAAMGLYWCVTRLLQS